MIVVHCKNCGTKFKITNTKYMKNMLLCSICYYEWFFIFNNKKNNRKNKINQIIHYIMKIILSKPLVQLLIYLLIVFCTARLFCIMIISFILNSVHI